MYDVTCELSTRDRETTRAELFQREYELTKQQDAIMSDYLAGHITSQQAIERCQPIVAELQGLIRPRHDIPFTSNDLGMIFNELVEDGMSEHEAAQRVDGVMICDMQRRGLRVTEADL
jgi:hypothetical protein